MSNTVLTFVIVGQEDHPIFGADLAARGGEVGSKDDRAQYLHQFILHAALDAVDEQQWQSQAMFLGVVDKFNNLQVGRRNAGPVGAGGPCLPVLAPDLLSALNRCLRSPRQHRYGSSFCMTARAKTVSSNSSETSMKCICGLS